MRVKGFFLTIDSLLGLAVLLLAAGTLALGAQEGFGNNNYGALETLGRDYLSINYVQSVPLSTAQFNNLTGFTVSELQPASTVNLSIGSSLFVYPFPIAGCGCAGATCNITGGANATCLNAQENLTNATKRAWVTP